MNCFFTDTHCHLYNGYYDDVSSIIKNANDNNVCRFINAGCDVKGNLEVIDKLSLKEVYGVIGYHPEEADNITNKEIDLLERQLNNKKIIGIGEIGLDYHYGKKNKDAQLKLFELQLQMASKYKLPVVIHSRDATKDTIDVLKKYPDVRGVIHSFSGSKETANIYISMGYKLGINGVVTFKNSNLKDILNIIINDIVLETDSPYLTPHPNRGTRNEPKYISDIAFFISHYTGISIEELMSITNNNINEVFDI